uniref:Bacterial bifunctional deaminase-reductase C-terminal domain-containing protein n=1 Tax=Hanusia phi TaxID=3032 RepID=A0A7S0I1D4_9CRYP|mmetsp:Transcript_7956/g.18144  ORF Transcript_7956/g.18144 Transcript_7956/m.18144 type:complete len:446 (+) Transcript_7956:67-1404(+)
MRRGEVFSIRDLLQVLLLHLWIIGLASAYERCESPNYMKTTASWRAHLGRTSPLPQNHSLSVLKQEAQTPPQEDGREGRSHEKAFMADKQNASASSRSLPAPKVTRPRFRSLRDDVSRSERSHGEAVVEEVVARMKTSRESQKMRRGASTVSFVSPFVTLTYAQTLDGSIATFDKRPMQISCNKSMIMTHLLRSVHDCILVGIGTVRSDDPSLTVRLCNGSNPKPVILDAKLTIENNCRLLSSPQCVRPIIACSTDRANSTRASELEALGCKVMGCQVQEDGQVDLNSLLFELTSLGMKSVMVEGGAKVIKSFLVSHLVNSVVVTVAPKLAGGLSVLGVPAEGKVAAAAAMAPHAGRNQGSEEEVAGQGRKTKELAVSHPASRILRALQTLSSSARCLFERLLDKFLPPRQGTAHQSIFDILSLRDVRYVQVGVDLIVHGTLSSS